MGAYIVGNKCVEFTLEGACAVTGTDPMLIAHLSEEAAFHALGGVANRGVELRVWKAVADSLVAFPLDWIKAFKAKPLKPTHPLAQVVERSTATLSLVLSTLILWLGAAKSILCHVMGLLGYRSFVLLLSANCRRWLLCR
jgi:hypothetical protein